MMVNMPGTEYAAERRATYPELGVGLHFNLTLGRPISPSNRVLSLVDAEGEFYGRHKFESLALFKLIQPLEVARELQAQFDRLCALGVTPTHIDSHQHVHVFPVIFDVVAEFAQRRNLPLRIPWVWARGQVRPRGWRRRIRSDVLYRMLQRNTRRWDGRIRFNSSFFSFFDGDCRHIACAAQELIHFLAYCTQDPVEWMVHPAEVDADLRRRVDISDMNAFELSWLSGADVPKLLAGQGWERIHFGQLT